MKQFFQLISIVLFASNTMALPVIKTKTGISLNAAWKQKIYDYAQANVKHSAWGVAHSERDYQMSITLAKQEGIKVDTDVIFATAFLHDIGAIDDFRKKDLEHSIRSVEIAEPLLQSYGFPMQKWPGVKTAILSHMYYSDRPANKDKEAIIFRDADALDFFGAIGIVRLVSITERHKWAPSLAGALTTLQEFKTDLPIQLMTVTAKKIAAQRALEMDRFFSLLKQETVGGRAL